MPAPGSTRFLLAGAAAIALAEFACLWQLAAQTLISPSSLLAAGALGLAGAAIALLIRAARSPRPALAGPVLIPMSALRRRSRAAVFQRQINPDAAGRARPRAPSDAPAAA